MAAKSDTPTRDALLVKYLNEAYGKERQLETALQAQIKLASRPQLKKGLQDHHKVTKAQAKALQKRIRELGGKATTDPALPGPGVVAGAAGAVTGAANQALAAAKGPVQALRGTGQADHELRNVRDCYWNEAEEIAHYHVIEAAADALGDKETAKLARDHRREEERMQKLLERQIAPLVKEVAKEEIPNEELRAVRPAPRRRSASSSAKSSSSSAKSSSKSSSSSSRKRSATAGDARRKAASSGR